MAYFSRVSPNHLSSYPVELISLVKDAQHERDLDDLDAVKRSFYAMEILTGTSASHFAIQDNHFAAISKVTIKQEIFIVLLLTNPSIP